MLVCALHALQVKGGVLRNADEIHYFGSAVAALIPLTYLLSQSEMRLSTVCLRTHCSVQERFGSLKLKL